MLSAVICGLPICLPLALAFAIPDRTRSRIIAWFLSVFFRRISHTRRDLYFCPSLLPPVFLAFTLGLDRYGDPSLLFLGILIGGLGVSFFSSLCLYGFGDCIDDISIMTSQIVCMTDDIQDTKDNSDEQ